MKILLKIDRLSAWILLIGMILYFISGFGMTKGIIGADLSRKIHLDWLTLLIIIAFVFHAGFATRLALIRWQLWNKSTGAIWALFFIAFLSYFIYVDRFYRPAADKTASEDVSGSPNGKVTTNENSSSSESMDDTDEAQSDLSSNAPSASNSSSINNQITVFNTSTLAKYDGKNGKPAYVAVDGKVYDLTGVFITGKHYSHYAGRELTNAFLSYHASRTLSRYPVVGTFQL